MSRVSIIIPTYNRADLLSYTLESALAQTYRDYEIIVIDNASTDDTPQLMAQYAGHARYIRKPQNKGLIDSYNIGFREAAGEFILLLDSDDTIHPDMLAKQVGYLDQHPSMDLVRTGGFYVDAAGSKIARMRISPMGSGRQMLAFLVFGNFEMCGSILYRKTTVERIGPQEESLPVYGDWDYSLRMAMQDCNFGFLAEPLFFYRFHAGNSMKKVNAVESASSIILDKLFADTDLPAEIKPLRNQAYAQADLFLAFSYYATQAPEDAQRCMLRAWEGHPQWHEHPASMLDTMLDYSLYMHTVNLEQFAGDVMAHLPAALPSLRAHEPAWTSRIHLLMAFHHYDRANMAAGMEEVNKALAVDPSLINRRKTFAVLLRQFALQAVTDPPVKFVQAVLTNLPEQARSLRSLRNEVEADMELIAAYASMKVNDQATARHFARALRLQPTLAGRRGVVGPLLRSLARQLKRA